MRIKELYGRNNMAMTKYRNKSYYETIALIIVRNYCSNNSTCVKKGKGDKNNNFQFF